MLREVEGDVFEALKARTGATVFLHGCNAQGGMGAGVAKIVKERYPIAYEEYREACLDAKTGGDSVMGDVIFSFVERDAEHPLIIANGITQEWYGRDPERRYACPDAISSVIRDVESEWGTTTHLVAVRVGAGYGGLDWEEDVKPLFEESRYQWTVYYLDTA